MCVFSERMRAFTIQTGMHTWHYTSTYALGRILSGVASPFLVGCQKAAWAGASTRRLYSGVSRLQHERESCGVDKILNQIPTRLGAQRSSMHSSFTNDNIPEKTNRNVSSFANNSTHARKQWRLVRDSGADRTLACQKVNGWGTGLNDA